MRVRSQDTPLDPPVPYADTTDAEDYALLFRLLSKTGLAPEEAHVTTKLIAKMSAANIVERFESKLDAQRVELGAKLDAQTTRITVVQWALGFGLAIMAAILAF